MAAVGHKYYQLEKQIGDTANRQWNDATAGNVMWCLCGGGYAPTATHTTTANLTDLIAAGDGAPMNATGLAIDNTTTAGTTYYDSDDVNFGATVSITAKYLIAVQPVTAGTFSATTSKLLFYIDLDNSTGWAEVSSSAAEFVIQAPANGWFKTT